MLCYVRSVLPLDSLEDCEEEEILLTLLSCRVASGVLRKKKNEFVAYCLILNGSD